MPVQQIPVIGVQGLHTDKYDPGATADYRYYLNGYFEKTESQTPDRQFTFTKRPGFATNFVALGSFANGHRIQGFVTSVDRTTQVLYTNNGTNANTTWWISGGTVTSRGTAPAATGNWTYTGPVAFATLDGISYGRVAGIAPISSITNVTTTATLTTSSPHGLATGTNITVSGTTPAAYSGTFTINVSSSTVFTYTTLSDPGGAASVVGAYAPENAYFVVTDLTKAALVGSSGAWIEITDADFTGLNKCTNIIGMDGYLFVGTTTNRIYNCDLNTSISWSALGFLTAADTPGRLLWLSRIRNYLIVFKDKSIEFFEDVGNPTPGSPLEARKSLNSRVGLLNRNSVQEVSDGIIFAGTTEAGMAQMYKISHHDMSIKPISNRYIEQMLCMVKVATTTTDYSVDARASASFMGQSQAFYLMGKEFYSINIPDVNGGEKNTQVYDNTLGIWTSWVTSFTTAGTTDTYGLEVSQAQEVAINGITVTAFVNNTFVDGSNGPRLLIVNPSTPIWYDLKPTVTQNYYTFAWTSDQVDFGNRKRKFCDSVEIHYTGDSSAAPSNAASTTLSLKYRDYDYNATSGYIVTRSLFYDPGGGVRCMARRLGSFRKRSFTILLNAIAAMKLWSVEVTFNQGEQDQEG